MTENNQVIEDLTLSDPNDRPSLSTSTQISIAIKRILTNSYFKFILKKLIFYSFVFFIAVSVAFFIPRLLPGDPLAQLLIPPAGMSDEALAEWLNRKTELEAYLGLDQPLWKQFLIFWRELLHGNFGYEYRNLIPVTDLVLPRLKFSLMIVIPVIILSFFIGNFVGALVGFKKTWWKNIIYYFFVFLQSAPYFWTAYIFTDIFIRRNHWVHPLPPSANTLFVESLKLFLLIVTILTLTFSGGWATGARSMMIYETESDYMLYCRKLGFSDRKLRQYGLRNALLPQITGLNLRFNECLGATFIIEFVFSWPGLGWLTIQAMTAQNYTLIIGTFIVNIIIVVLGNFLIDILYGFIDPRIRVVEDED